MFKIFGFTDTDRVLLLRYVNMARSGLCVKTKQDALYGGTRESPIKGQVKRKKPPLPPPKYVFFSLVLLL